MNRFATAFLLVFLLANVFAFAQKSNDLTMLNNGNSSRLEFVQNKGQIIDLQGNINSDVLFVASVPNGAVYVYSDAISFAFYKIDVPAELDISKQFPIETYRIDMKFRNALHNPKIDALDQLDDYNNYYLAQCPNGITNVNKFRKIRINNLYKNIDFILYENSEKKIQYDFIVKPGGNPDDIQILFEGEKGIEISENGSLIVSTPLGKLEQAAPYSYQIIDNQSQIVESSFALNKDKSVAFQLGKYDDSHALTIDPPTRMWGTYFGSTLFDNGQSVVNDDAGNVYMCGYTYSITSFATSGSHQQTAGSVGGVDAYLAKFNSSGEIQWATYYGGSDGENANAVAVDKLGNVLLCGITYSSNAIASPGAFKTTYSGSSKAFLAKFNAAGVRAWATYFGGNNAENAYRIAIDNTNNIYMCGSTSSTLQVATAGTHQTTKLGGTNAFLAKFSIIGQRTWATYFGGNSDTYATSVVVDENDNVFMCGSTKSTDAANISTGGAFQQSIGGGEDAFVAKFNSSGIRQWGSYYGGTLNDKALSIVTDNQENLYVAGYAKSNVGVATSGSFREVRSSNNWDAFLVKFNNLTNVEWGTFYAGGNDGDISTSKVCLSYDDSEDNVFMCGFSADASGISTPDAYQPVKSSTKDAYLVKFNSVGERIWGTYYGGTGNDYAHGICNDGLGMIFMCGETMSVDSIASPGAHQTVYSADRDAFLVKLKDSPVDKILIRNFTQNVFCEGQEFTVNFIVSGIINPGNVFTVQLSDASGSFVAPIPIGSLVGNVVDTIYCQIPFDIPQGLNYRIRIISTSSVIIGKDNAFDIEIYSMPNPEINGKKKVCPSSVEIYKTPTVAGIITNWVVTKGTIAGDPGADSIKVNWQGKGVGTIKLIQVNSASGCIDSAETEVIINLPEPFFTGDMVVCQNGTGNYTSNSIAGVADFWSVKGGEIVGDTNSSSVTINWGNSSLTRLKLIQTIEGSGCKDSIDIPIELVQMQKPKIAGDLSVCAFNEFTYFSATPSKTSIRWEVQGGEITSDSSSNELRVRWDSAGTGKLQVIHRNNEAGCLDTNLVLITINKLPTPDISGDNDVCNFSTLAYSSSSSAGIANKWKVSGGTILGNDDKSTVNIRWENTGIGTVSLVQTNPITSCKDSTSFNVVINPLPMPVISGNSDVCYNSTETYKSNAASNSSVLWTVENGTILGANNQEECIIKWDQIGSAKLSLILINDLTNCKDSSALAVNVVPFPKPQINGIKEICLNEVAEYSTNILAGSSYFWKATGGEIIGNNDKESVSIKWLSSTNCSVKLIQSIGDNSCSDSSSINIKVNPLPIAVIVGKNNVREFTNEAYQVEDNTQYSYLWTALGGSIADNSKPNIVVTWNNAGSGSIIVQMRDLVTNCTSFDTLSIDIKPADEMIVNAGNSINICLNESATIGNSNPVEGGIPPFEFLWSPALGLSNAAVPNPIASPQTTTKYTLLVTDSKNNSANAELTVTVHSLPSPVINGTAFANAGATEIYASNPILANTNLWIASGGTIIGDNSKETIEILWGVGPSGSIKLIQTNEFGCKDSIAMQVSINNVDTTKFPILLRAGVLSADASELSAQPGKTVSLPIYFKSTAPIADSSRVKFQLSFNNTLLSPNNHSIISTVKDVSTIALDESLSNIKNDSLLLEIPFTVGLGNSEECDLNITKFETNIEKIEPTLLNGKFSLYGVCQEGGARLINPMGKAEFFINSSNPSNGELSLGFNLIENSLHSLRIVNANGKIIYETKFNKIHEMSIDTKGFDSGIYYITMQSETISKTLRFVLTK